MYEVPMTWSEEIAEGELSLRRSYVFRSQKRLLDFVRSLLEMSNEFLVNPVMEIRFPKISVTLSAPERERDRLSIFAMAIEELSERLNS